VRIYGFFRPQSGVTAVEALVAIVVAGALAAVAVPALSSDDSEGRAASDAEAKAVAATAAQAMELCKTRNGGTYANCTKEALIAIEPSLAGAGDRLLVTTGGGTYDIGVASKRDPKISFTVSRAADGTTARACTTNGEWDGGCRPRFTGTW
jgi:Tfp pilus assembly protein PilE